MGRVSKRRFAGRWAAREGSSALVSFPMGCVGGICAFQARPVRAIFVPPLWVVLGSGLRRAAACGCSGVLGRQTRPRRAAGPVTSLGPCPLPASVMRSINHRRARPRSGILPWVVSAALGRLSATEGVEQCPSWVVTADPQRLQALHCTGSSVRWRRRVHHCTESSGGLGGRARPRRKQVSLGLCRRLAAQTDRDLGGQPYLESPLGCSQPATICGPTQL